MRRSSKRTVCFRTVDAEKVVVSPENAVAMFYFCLARHCSSIDARSMHITQLYAFYMQPSACCMTSLAFHHFNNHHCKPMQHTAYLGYTEPYRGSYGKNAALRKQTY